MRHSSSARPRDPALPLVLFSFQRTTSGSAGRLYQYLSASESTPFPGRYRSRVALAAKTASQDGPCATIGMGLDRWDLEEAPSVTRGESDGWRPRKRVVRHFEFRFLYEPRFSAPDATSARS